MENPIKLSSFLKKKGVYDEFIMNFDKVFYTGFAKKSRAAVDLVNSFQWLGTIEGREVWSSLADEWDELKKDNKAEYDMNWLLDDEKEAKAEIIEITKSDSEKLPKSIKLSDFLKEHNVYEKFINNIKPYDDHPYTISNSFDWKDTSEGSGFWHDINNRWIEATENKKADYDLYRLLEEKNNSGVKPEQFPQNSVLEEIIENLPKKEVLKLIKYAIDNCVTSNTPNVEDYKKLIRYSEKATK